MLSLQHCHEDNFYKVLDIFTHSSTGIGALFNIKTTSTGIEQNFHRCQILHKRLQFEGRGQSRAIKNGYTH
jgi:hypothetical protein